LSTYSVVSKNGIQSRVSHFLKAMDIYACPSDKNRRGQQRQLGLQWASESKSSITIIRNYKKTIRKIEHQTSKKILYNLHNKKHNSFNNGSMFSRRKSLLEKPQLCRFDNKPALIVIITLCAS